MTDFVAIPVSGADYHVTVNASEIKKCEPYNFDRPMDGTRVLLKDGTSVHTLCTIDQIDMLLGV